MPSIQVDRYTLSIYRSVGGSGTVPRTLKVIRMLPSPGSAAAGITYVEFLYPTPAPTVVGEAPDTRVFGFFPPAEFEVHRLMLQSEAPIEVEWIPDDANPPALTRVTLRTSPEPVGEGPRDSTP
jgi:hypothetical protein